MSRALHLDPESYWLPVASAARLSDRSPATVRRWVAEGKVRSRTSPDGSPRVWLWSVFGVSDDTPRRASRARS